MMMTRQKVSALLLIGKNEYLNKIILHSGRDSIPIVEVQNRGWRGIGCARMVMCQKYHWVGEGRGEDCHYISTTDHCKEAAENAKYLMPHKYFKEINTVFTGYNPETENTNDWPTGCYVNGNRLWFNSNWHANGVHSECTQDRPCICRNKNWGMWECDGKCKKYKWVGKGRGKDCAYIWSTVHCKEAAEAARLLEPSKYYKSIRNGYEPTIEDTNDWPAGCYVYGGTVYLNHNWQANGKHSKCTEDRPCLCRNNDYGVWD